MDEQVPDYEVGKRSMMNRHESNLSDSECDDDYNDESFSKFSTSKDSHSHPESEDEIDARATIEQKLNQVKTGEVNRFRACIIVVLILAAIGVSLTVFFLSRNSDIEAFEIQYKGNADKIIQSFHSITVEHFTALAAFARDVTLQSNDHHVSWPNFTWSGFEGRAATARTLSGALSISIHHLVDRQTLPEWENYVLQNENNYWMDEGHAYQRSLGIDDFESEENIAHSYLSSSSSTTTTTHRTVDPVHRFETNGRPTTDIGPGPYLVRWQTSPLLKSNLVNTDLYHHELYQKNCTVNGKDGFCPVLSFHAFKTGSAVLGGLYSTYPGSPQAPPFPRNDIPTTTTTTTTTTTKIPSIDVGRPTTPLTSYYATLQSMQEGTQVNYLGDPFSFLFVPIFNSTNTTTTTQRSVVAIMEAVISWKTYFRKVVSDNVPGITVVLTNPCEGSFTYEIQGTNVYGVGFGDLHDPNFEPLEVQAHLDNVQQLKDGTIEGMRWNDLGCTFQIRMYPTQKYYDEFVTSSPINVTFAVGMVFSYTIILFILYDRLVEARQRLIVSKASKSTAIVESLFPKTVAEKMLSDSVDTNAPHNQKGSHSMFPFGQSSKIKTFLGNGGTDQQPAMNLQQEEEPIADLFPHCTIIFADIAGFTAWSSTREPALVFKLLQSVYSAFDSLAKRRKVFKVETIGDCYVAVTGLPHEQPNHALIMAKFARDCLREFRAVTQELEFTLGPGTADLGLRSGLHSGPVTAGVLRGERARFQLFGDTMNTAARMESTGEYNKIQCSQVTANILLKAGKESWIKKREDMVKVKGKGIYQTYWLSATASNGGDRSSLASSSENVSSRTEEEEEEEEGAFSQRPLLPTQTQAQTQQQKMNTKKHISLVKWVVNILEEHLKQILIRRKTANAGNLSQLPEVESVTYKPNQKGSAMNEVVEAISLPRFDDKIAAAVSYASSSQSNNTVEISETVRSQLWKYVMTIGSYYNDNAFHNFEHACHVTMATNKFLKRIVTPELDDNHYEFASQLHDYTHGINSDPITLFAIAFSALIHDVDHRGISNAQLAKEDEAMASCYQNKSVAEQNSLDLAWDLFMKDDFIDLRRCLFANNTELHRFRQVVVNVVLATDIFDKELNDLRKLRWEKAFSERNDDDVYTNKTKEAHDDLRATIVLEHIIQASDVSHTMQHWHIYRKWNFCLFKEMMQAYKSGRMAKSPLEFWYRGELGFFDNYIIPLAKKLKDCNVFGVSSDECLNYALANRAEWEERGEAVIQDMVNQIELQAS